LTGTSICGGEVGVSVTAEGERGGTYLEDILGSHVLELGFALEKLTGFAELLLERFFDLVDSLTNALQRKHVSKETALERAQNEGHTS
jgi:hypothetical protein